MYDVLVVNGIVMIGFVTLGPLRHA